MRRKVKETRRRMVKRD
jgi:hypothetical protein